MSWDNGEERAAKRRLRMQDIAITTLLVQIRNPRGGEPIKAYAMSDAGASNTHISSKLGKKLGLRGPLVPFLVGSHGGRV